MRRAKHLLANAGDDALEDAKRKRRQRQPTALPTSCFAPFDAAPARAQARKEQGLLSHRPRVTGPAGPGTSEHPTASLYLLFIVVVCWDICLVKRQSHCTQTSQGRVLRRVWAVARPAAGAGGAGAAGRLPRSTPSFR